MTNLSNQDSFCTDVSICCVNKKNVGLQKKKTYRMFTYICFLFIHILLCGNTLPAGWDQSWKEILFPHSPMPSFPRTPFSWATLYLYLSKSIWVIAIQRATIYILYYVVLEHLNLNTAHVRLYVRYMPFFRISKYRASGSN